MSNCPECNKRMGPHDLFVAGLCSSCAGKHITHQAKRIEKLEAALRNIVSESKSKAYSPKIIQSYAEQALKG